MYGPGPRIPSMREPALARKIPELIEGARLLWTRVGLLVAFPAQTRRAVQR